jgi:Tol biopolymer transport system component
MVDFNGRTVREVLGQAGRAAPETACWSPDGRYIAVLMFNFADDVGSMGDVANADWRIVIVDVTGELDHEVRLANATGVTISGLDWR